MRIAIWMYKNDGGFIPRDYLIQYFKSLGYEVFCDFNMRECHVINGSVFTKCGVNLSSYDLLFHMNADDQSDFQIDILKAVEDSGVQVVNDTNSYSICRDKFKTNQLLRNAGLKVPNSVLLGVNASKLMVESIFDKFESVVYKTLHGHGASGIIKFNDAETFWDFYETTKLHFSHYYLEEFINFGDSDIRIEIVDGEIVGGYSRKKSHSYKTNIATGGKMIPRKMAIEGEIALSAAKTLKISSTIIDMVQSIYDDHIYILEVNPLLGIFVESAMRNTTKMVHTEPEKEYSYDQVKLESLKKLIVGKLNIPTKKSESIES